MTITFSKGDQPPTDLLAALEQWLTDAAEQLAQTVQAIKAGEHSKAKEAQDCIKALKTTVNSAIEERSRVEKLRKQTGGTVGAAASDAAFDLDAARAEIGSRLARLRDAGGD